jgi:hypothetical protein
MLAGCSALTGKHGSRRHLFADEADNQAQSAVPSGALPVLAGPALVTAHWHSLTR